MRFRPLYISILSLALVGASLQSVAHEEFYAKSGFYGPRKELHYAKPTLRWEIWSDQGSVISASMTVNGQPVDAQYDTDEHSLCYTPKEPLQVGISKVHCSVTFAGNYTFTRDWETPVASTAIPEFPAPTQAQIQALEAANAYRARLGLPPFRLDPRLDAAAQAHADYLTANNCQGHGENPSQPGFLAPDPNSRLELFGWGGASWEGLTYYIPNPQRSIQNLFDAPYHRRPFLEPGPLEFGFGLSGTNATAEFGAKDETVTNVSPADGETNVPTSWISHETPDPLAIHPEAVQGSAVGYPIILAEFGKQKSQLHIDTAELTQTAGTAVKCYLNTPENDKNLTGCVVMIPAEPLKPSSDYRVSVSGTEADGRPIKKTWSFHTTNG